MPGPLRGTARAAVTAAVLAAGTPAAGVPPPLPEIERYEDHPVYTVLPPDALRSIDAPRHVAGGGAAFLDDGEDVLGVVVRGEARAYPLAELHLHEVVNDRLGGRPIAVTW